MNSWSQENYTIQQGMGMPMNMMPNVPPLLPPPMCIMPDVPPMHPPPSVPMQLLNQPPMPDTTNEDVNEIGIKDESKSNDVSSSHSRRKSRERERRDRDGSQRRDRERDRSGLRAPDRDHSSRQDKNDRQDRSRRGNQRERRSKWGDKEKDETPIIGPVIPNAMNMQGNMMLQGMGNPNAWNMMQNNMMQPNMMQSMPNNMMMGSQQMDQSQMMSQMNMMNNMMPNMMDQNMMNQNMIMNQQMMGNMGMIGNQPIYMNSGVLLPPLPGVQTPPRREKPKGCRTIFVGGLPSGITMDTLNEIFQRFGPIDSIKSPKNNAYYVRYQRMDCIEPAFTLSGFRFKFHDQLENEATTIFIDYALNREDQNEYEKMQRKREPTPPRVEPFTPVALTNLAEKIKTEEEFSNVAPTLAAWLERGECNKKNANAFYSLIQVSNNQIRRLFNEKMQLDEEFQTVRTTFRDKFARVVLQFEQVAKILSAAKHQRVSDHFTKQQRRNIEMWLKMTEEVENIKEEFQSLFDEDETEKVGKNAVPLEKYEELKAENENLTYELEGYKNEAHLAKDEAERRFEKFKAHFIAQQALQNKPQVFPPLPKSSAPKPPPPLPEDSRKMTSAPVPPSEARLISILTAFLMVHPLGASIDYLTSYVKSMTPNVTQADVQVILQKYDDVFNVKVTGVGASIDHRWTFATFDIIKGYNM